MEYQVYEVQEELQFFLKCFWSMDAPATVAKEKQRIVPDGCMEMIFHYGDLYEQFLPGGQSILQPRCFVFGQITSPLEIAPTGISGIIAARFQPDGFLPFSAYPIQQMENKAVSLTTLFGEKAKELEAQVLQSKTNEQRMKHISAFLLNELQQQEVSHRITKSGIETLLQSNGQLGINELAAQLQINRRQLERKFLSAIGLSPKQLSKVIRLQAAIKLLKQKKFNSLTELAYESGYYDQAHFIKDFKEFTGVSPKEFYSGNLALSMLFSGED